MLAPHPPAPHPPLALPAGPGRAPPCLGLPPARHNTPARSSSTVTHWLRAEGAALMRQTACIAYRSPPDRRKAGCMLGGPARSLHITHTPHSCSTSHSDAQSLRCRSHGGAVSGTTSCPRPLSHQLCNVLTQAVSAPAQRWGHSAGGDAQTAPLPLSRSALYRSIRTLSAREAQFQRDESPGHIR